MCFLQQLGNILFEIFKKSERKSVCIKSYHLIRKSDNMNSPPKKNSISPNKIKKKSLASERFKEWFNTDRLKKVSSDVLRQKRYHKKHTIEKNLSLDNHYKWMKKY